MFSDTLTFQDVMDIFKEDSENETDEIEEFSPQKTKSATQLMMQKIGRQFGCDNTIVQIPFHCNFCKGRVHSK